MNDKNPSVLKLSNGEDIICHVIDNIGDTFIKEPTDKELNKIEQEEIEELIEELDNATIH